MNCDHRIELLMGTADGIVCRGCGRLFRNFDEIHPKEQKTESQPEPIVEKKAAAPKKTRKKKEAE